uniref:Insulin-like peptide 2 n=1 Tax=Gnatocerus cornutus TaxID=1553328 RepID=A0A7G1GD26_9CUCU|nr:insulin-like peptide 2 [Gnatocerus cornutus]
MDLQCVFVVLATVLAGLCSIDADEMSDFNSKKVYCGRHLSQTLSAVCKGKYNTLNKKYETKPESFGSGSQGQFITDLGFPYQTKASASTLMTNFRRRRRRGVFNECCEKPCSQEELKTYCGSRRR